MGLYNRLMTDEELINLIQKGKQEKFGLVIDRYEKKLFFYLKNLINQSGEDVEDLLQEVFVSVYVNIQSFDTQKKFSSWIYRIAHNNAVDYFKSKKRLRSESLDFKEDYFDNNQKLAEDLEIETERNLLIKKYINELDIKYKESILLFYYENRSYEEISDILHIPPSQVGVLLFRAKKLLKHKLIKLK